MWGLAASLIGGGLSSKASSKAADAQRSAAIADRQYQEETRDLIFDRLNPYYQGGVAAQNALDFELGLGSRPTFGGTVPAIQSFYEGGAPGQAGGGWNGAVTNALMNGGRLPTSPAGAGGVQKFRVGDQVFNTMEDAQAYANANRTGGTAYGGYTKTPGYDFRMKEGLNAIESSAAARGGLYSGAALKASQQFGQDYATSEYENYLAKLANRAGVGMGAATGQANAATNAAAGVSNAIGAAGNAAAAGAIGRGNALVGGMQNLATNWNYMRNMGGQGGVNGNGAWANPLFGGPGLGNFF